MNKLTLIGTTALTAGMLFALPASAANYGGGYGYPTAPGYGGMPGYGYNGYMPMPFGFRGPMYGPGYGMPAMPPMRGYGPRHAPGQQMRRQAMPYAQGGTAVATDAATAEAAKPAVETAAEAADVSIRQMQFVPARIVVKKGGTVTWTQNDRMPHNVTASNGGFGSDTLNSGGTFSQTFDETGTFSYYCGLHPSMRGEVVVVD